MRWERLILLHIEIIVVVEERKAIAHSFCSVFLRFFSEIDLVLGIQMGQDRVKQLKKLSPFAI